jgi:DNA gyrase/topoisomerase IV subunit B
MATLNTSMRSLHKVTISDVDEAKDYIKQLMTDTSVKYQLIIDYKDTFLEKIQNDLM